MPALDAADDEARVASEARGAIPAVSAGARFIEVRVKPNARVSTLRLDEAGAWRAELKAPPVDGKANAELVALVARHFRCSRSAVSIRSGGSSRTKLVKIDAPAA
jgi:uncharacterized protein (TIGR00251 family)